MPFSPGDRERRPRRPAASLGSFQIRTSSAVSSRAVTRSSRESPEPSAMCTPGHRDAVRGQVALRHGGAGRGRAEPERPVADRLQHHLGGEVVAPVVHELEDLRQRLRVDRRDRDRARPGGPCDRAAGADPARVQEPVEVGRGGQGRIGDETVVPRRAVDDERRERRRLDAGEGREPAGRDALVVEGRGVADDPARHVPDPLAPEDPGEALQIGRRERRVAEPLDDELPLPRVPDPVALAEHLGREPVLGAELDERRVGDGELLVRGGLERDVRVAREDDLAARQRHDHRRRRSRDDAVDPERVGEAAVQAARAGARDCAPEDSGQGQDSRGDDERAHHQIGFCRMRRSPARRGPRD